MLSIRTACQSIGVNKSSLSVLRDFFGYDQRRVPNPLTGAPASVSMLGQISRIKGKHFHLNVIRVGTEDFTQADQDEIDETVHLTRTIFGQEANLGIGRVKHYHIPLADADGLETITSNADAAQLAADWTVDNNGLDLFIVLAWTGNTLGLSNVDGPCNKDKDLSGMSASVTAMTSSNQESGHTTAHELGHYLGLSHRNKDATNLMAQTSAVNNLGGTIATAINLDSGQVKTVRKHCFIQDGI